MKALTKETLRIYWQHTARYPWYIVGVILLIIGSTAAAMYIPFMYKRFFDVLATVNNGGYQNAITLVWWIFAANGVRWVLFRITAVLNMYHRPRIIMDVRNTIYGYLHKHSYNFFNNNFSGSIVKRFNEFARGYRVIDGQLLWGVGKSFITVIAVAVVLCFYNLAIGLIMIGWVILLVTFQILFAKYKLPYDLEKAKTGSAVSGHLADTITSQLNVKLFGGFKHEAAAHKEHNERWRAIIFKSWKLMEISMSVQTFMMMILEFGMFYVAVRFWNQGIFTIGDFALIQAYVLQTFQNLWNLGENVNQIYEALAEANEMTEIITTEHEVKDVKNARKLKIGKGNVDFTDVNFSYIKGTPVFSDFNLNINAGERIALVGASGSGKSSLTKLLFRFIDIQSGTISVDGQNISQVTQDSLRNNISLVPQDPILFHRSLTDNIRYGNRTATDKQVIEAAKLAHCHEFISSFPDKYKTLVGERGVKLSGGERQRVAIARAILKNAPILVLDEATSSLDSESEHLIQDALEKLMKGKTTIVIAHRLSTIMQMDRIIVMEKGAIIEQGTHAELSKKKNGQYKKLWDIQVGGFIG